MFVRSFPSLFIHSFTNTCNWNVNKQLTRAAGSVGTRMWQGGFLPVLTVLFPAISWGDFPQNPKSPRKTPKIQKALKMHRIYPQICVTPPSTWSLELTLGFYVNPQFVLNKLPEYCLHHLLPQVHEVPSCNLRGRPTSYEIPRAKMSELLNSFIYRCANLNYYYLDTWSINIFMLPLFCACMYSCTYCINLLVVVRLRRSIV